VSPSFPSIDTETAQTSVLRDDGVLAIKPRSQWPKHVAITLDIFTATATSLVVGYAVGSVVDWDWPVDTLWVSPRALAELGVQDGDDISVSWTRTCHHGKHAVGQPVTVRVAPDWNDNEAALVVAKGNPKVYCRVYYS
jgi:hypothetical protein